MDPDEKKYYILIYICACVINLNFTLIINFFLGVWWWNPTLKSNLYDINIIPFKIYLQFYVSRINFVNFPRLSFSIKRKTSSNVPNYVWWFCCWPIKLQKLKFQTSFFFFFSWCALGYNSIPTLVCGLRNPLAIIIIIIITIISCLASSHHQELSLAREGVTVYWNENYLSNTYRIYIYYYRKWKGYYTLIMQSNFFNIYLIHLSLKNNSN
jgi:hypothetical protein